MPDITNIGLVGYGLCSILFLSLSIISLSHWRGRLNGITFFLFCLFTALWSAIAAYYSLNEYPVGVIVISAELIRNVIWTVFLVQLIYLLNPSQKTSQSFVTLARFAYGIPCVLLILTLYMALSNNVLPILGFDFRVLGHILIAIICLSFVEQIFRSAGVEQRWGLKFLCFAVGSLCVFDFYLYSDALLFKELDLNIWKARGFVYCAVIPLIVLAILRNPISGSTVTVSRSVVFYTATIIATGLYLLTMSAGGFYLRQFGGNWGAIAATTFVFTGLLFLLILFFSGHIRARIRVFIDKHFLDYKYDYRDQWLGLIRSLSGSDKNIRLEQRALQAITEITDSPGGSLWIRKNQQQFIPIANMGMSEIEKYSESIDSSLILFLEQWQWVINLEEYRFDPDLYAEFEMPDWLKSFPNAWLVVPLMLQAHLYGFIIVLHPRAPRNFNWEDIDLLKTAGRQVAIHLAQERSALALVQARQFEAFNRFSAYVVHDLKNLVSQLALVVKNAEKHKHNPAFMDDAISTVDNAVDRMNRLLAQLRAGAVSNEFKKSIKLRRIIDVVIGEKSINKPIPTLAMENDIHLRVDANEARLISILGHLVQNAQDATNDSGNVEICLRKVGENALIEIRDTGIGMDKQFILDRLYKPFDTTKGLTGMGIGAHDAKAFIEEIGGILDVESEEGKGTKFSIKLPLSN